MWNGNLYPKYFSFMAFWTENILSSVRNPDIWLERFMFQSVYSCVKRAKYTRNIFYLDKNNTTLVMLTDFCNDNSAKLRDLWNDIAEENEGCLFWRECFKPAPKKEQLVAIFRSGSRSFLFSIGAVFFLAKDANTTSMNYRTRRRSIRPISPRSGLIRPDTQTWDGQTL